ncbi:MAG: hypothetical protein KKG47_14290 [Proteobacteria bacterium]|nr:hypothetical protein [Pseudomonadota bacterium]MBU1738336.1 hypothetical protein [Pseudomonadota bacterium]
MECERLQKLIKNWYIQVQDESMAPARMVEFMRNHVADCLICMADPVVEAEVKRITEVVLPPSKIPKAVRKEEGIDDDDEDDEETTDSDEVEEDEEEDEEEEDEEDIDPDLDDDEV